MIKVKNISEDKFKNLIAQGEKIVLFCAGQALFDLCEKYHLEKNVLYAVDNYKAGQSITVNGYHIPVVSVDDIGDEKYDVLSVITSLQYTREIIQQLDSLPKFDGTEFAVPYIFTLDREATDISVELKQLEPRIPKVIHYCWFGKTEMPEQFKRNIETWKKHCPDYEIKRWDESNYDVSKNRYMKQAYEAKKWGFVPDYARLDIINTYGGIYLDTDVEVIKSFDDLLGVDLFCGFEDEYYVAFGLGFGATPNNKILLEMMKQYGELEFVRKDGKLNLIASPVYQSEIMEKCGFVLNGKTQLRGRDVVLAPEYLAPISKKGLECVTERTYSIHQYAATWFDEELEKNREKEIDFGKMLIEHM